MANAKNKLRFKSYAIKMFLLLMFISANQNKAIAQCLNVALYKPVTGTGPGSGGTVPGNAFDGNCNNTWNSGRNATQSIQVDLLGLFTINNINLITAMTPDGNCTHNIYTAPNTSGPWTLVDVISGYRFSGEKLERCYSPALVNVGAVKVETTSSPSWVAWKEIGVYMVLPSITGPIITASGPLTFCQGDSVVLTSSPMPYYSWSNGATTQSITVKTSSIYCVSLGGACSLGSQACSSCSVGTACVEVRVKPKPLINLTASANPICARTSTTLYANGGGSYQWSTGDTVSPITVSPRYTTTTYGVTVTNDGCVSTGNITVVPLIPPAIEAGPNVAICQGSSAQLNATGGRAYSWYPSTGLSNAAINNPVANPSVTTTYYVNSALPVNTNIITNGSFEQGYVGFQSSYIYQSNLQPEATFYVGRNPRTYHPNFSQCTDHTSGAGNMMIVNASGTPGVSVWCQTIAIAANTDYDFSTWAASVHPQSPAILQFSINGQMMGAPFNLSGTTCVWSHFFATWNSGSSTTANICIVNQNTALSGNDFALDDIYFSPICYSMDSVVVTVKPLPTMDAGLPQTICSGQSALLTATGGATYQWNTGASTAIITVSPVTTTTYTVTATTNGCSKPDDVVVTVNPTPIVSISASANPICSGDSIILTANGAAGYSWHGGLGSANSVRVAPPTNEIYSVTGTTLGCSSDALINITVNPVPEVTISALQNPICAGSSTTVIAGGAATYIWAGGMGTANYLNLTLDSTATFSVTGTTTGCSDTASITVKVNPIYNLNNPQTICNGQTYTFNAHNYTTAGTYYDTLLTVKGCDSVIITLLTVNPVYRINNPQTICDGQTYSFNSHNYTITGTYYDTLATTAGCDSVIITQLTVNPVFRINNPQTICNGQTYTFNSHNYTTTGIYYDTLSTISGCDSVFITRLTVNPTYNQNVTTAICSGGTFIFPDGTSTNITTTHTSNLITVAGCDSIIITALIVNPVYSINNPQTICNGQIYSFNLHNYTITGTYYDTLLTIAGCDSIIVTQLTVNPVYHINNPQTICNGQTYTFNSHNYINTGIYYDTLSTVSGCDSVFITLLTINPTYNQNVTAAICSGDTYIFPDGAGTTVTTTHTSNLITVAGCDSIIITTLIVNPVYSINNPQTICSGQTYSFNSHNYTSAGIYYDTLISIAGCDSVIVTLLNVNPVYSTNNPQTICDRQTYTFNSHNYTIAGTYYDTLSTVAGCDSVVITQLTVNPVYRTNNPQAICNGQTYLFNSHSYTTTGIYYDTLTTIAGCDSLIVTMLTVNPVYNQNVTTAICNGETFIFPDGSASAVATTHTSNLNTVAGCDSIIITTLNVNPVFVTDNPQTICNGHNYSLNLHIYSTPGTYFDTLTTISGCDSVIITRLTVNPIYNQQVNAVICNGETYFFPDGTSSTISTTHYSDLTTINACDSIIFTTLTVNPTYSINNPQTICNGQVYSLNFHDYTIDGTYYDTLTTISGCDSVIITRLTVNPVYNQNASSAICNGDTYIFPDGTTSTIASTHTSNLRSVNGCDSIINTTLTINPVYISNNPQTICNGQTYSFNSHNYNAAGTYYDTLTTISGCDSIFVTQLTVNPVYNQNTSAAICNGDTYIFPDGTASTTTAMHTSNFTTIAGCDSIIITNLLVNPTYSTNNPQTICDGQIYSLNSHNYTTAGIYYDILTSIAGCDSVIVTSLTVNPVFSQNASAAICNGDLYIFPDSSTSAIPTTHTSHLFTIYGCDSIIITILIVNPVYSTNNPQTICNGQIYSFNSHSYTLAGTYFDTLTTIDGCDSVIVTQLTVNPVYNQNSFAAICNGDTYIFPDGTTSAMATTHTSNLVTIAGCDSIIFTTLIVNPVYITDNPQTICAGQTYSLNSHNYTVAGTYYDTLTTTEGCDSVIVTQLTVNPVYSTNNPQTICNGKTYSFNSHNYTIAGNYLDTLTTIAGCDSVIVTQLTVNPVYSINNPQSICSGFSYSYNSHFYFATGTYYDTLATKEGCDSIIVTLLIVIPNPTVSISASANPICMGSATLLTAYGATDYLWSDGLGNANHVSVIPSSSTTYMVTGTLNGCINTSSLTVTVNPIPSVTVTPSLATICEGDTVELMARGATTYIWSPSIGLSSSTSASVIARPSVTSTFLVTGTSLGCSKTASVTINVNPLPIANFVANPENVSIFKPEIHFQDMSVGALPLTWHWTLGNGDSSSIPDFDYTYSDTGKFLVTLLVYNQYGCVDSVHDFVVVHPDYTIFIPNAFTPNSDLKNDRFRAYGTGISEFNMKVFNRWGELLFETDNLNTGWDGKYKGSLLPKGIYIYYIYFTDALGTDHYRSGTISLL